MFLYLYLYYFRGIYFTFRSFFPPSPSGHPFFPRRGGGVARGAAVPSAKTFEFVTPKDAFSSRSQVFSSFSPFPLPPPFIPSPHPQFSLLPQQPFSFPPQHHNILQNIYPCIIFRRNWTSWSSALKNFRKTSLRLVFVSNGFIFVCIFWVFLLVLFLVGLVIAETLT